MDFVAAGLVVFAPDASFAFVDAAEPAFAVPAFALVVA